MHDLAGNEGLRYTAGMGDGAIVLVVMGGVGCLVLLRLFWFRHRAAKQADQLLKDVVKAKDAFRR